MLRIVLFFPSLCFGDEPQKQVLIFYSDDPNIPANFLVSQAIRSTLKSGSPKGVQIFHEALESSRIPNDKYEAELLALLQRKYQGVMFDLIIPISGTALEFVLKYRDQVFPGTPIVFMTLDESRVAGMTLGSNITGVWGKLELSPTLDITLALHPGTQRVVVVSSSSPLGKSMTALAQKEFASYQDKVQFTYLTNLTITELRQALASLPPKTVVIYLNFGDTGGQFLSAPEHLALVTPSANAPIYVVTQTYFVDGVVGGRLLSYSAIGKRTGEVALSVLAGRRPEDIASKPVAGVTMFDWRQLKRWGISEERLPPGSTIFFKELTFWERYKVRVMVVSAMIAIQFLLIAFLLIERSARRRATKTLDKAHAELAHVSRVMTMGELVSSIAHEVNQPLTAIRTYGDASLRFLSADPPNLERLRAAIESSILNASRASEVINRIRSLVRRRGPEKAQLNINEIIREVIDLTLRERIRHRVQLELELEPSLPDIEGDRIQLQQVILNLILNGIESMNSINSRAKVLKIESLGTDQGSVLVTVSDTGIGLDPDDLNRVFDAFYSTKSEGMGMGLSISRTIIEKHDGRLWATSNGGQGAAFHFTLPT